ncbi:MAG: permease [Candidatus Omnitrophica bacterium]|nr:permease [Candidatus Omnitrophota bacterium]
MVIQFLYHLKHYTFKILPALTVGFLLSDIIQEFVSTKWAQKHLGTKGIKPILYSAIVGTIVPVCCWGSLPIAVTFFLKVASLGTVLSFLYCDSSNFNKCNFSYMEIFWDKICYISFL